MADMMINVDEALGRFNGNDTIYKMLLKKFVSSPYFEELKSFLSENNLEQAERSAHTIKGTAGNLSLTALYDISCILDEQLKNGHDYVDSFAQLQTVYDQTMGEIKSYVS